MITITENAGIKICELLEKEGKLGTAGLRVRAATACSGLQYQMFFDETCEETDVKIAGAGFSVYIDPESLEMMDGAVIDFEGGLNGAGFRIENPNASSDCSDCSESSGCS